jgi:predicted DCC family thiol-disulfide oxidoreductase YuxK
MSVGYPILFYDGGCGLCSRGVGWLLSHERLHHELRFAPLQGAIAADLLADCPEASALDSVIWYEPGAGMRESTISLRSDAVLRAWRYIGGAWGLLARAGRLVPRAWRDGIYGLIARHRHRLGAPVCVVPTPEQRARFLESG